MRWARCSWQGKVGKARVANAVGVGQNDFGQAVGGLSVWGTQEAGRMLMDCFGRCGSKAAKHKKIVEGGQRERCKVCDTGWRRTTRARIARSSLLWK